MAKQSNISFERDYLNSLKAGLKNFLKHHPKKNFHHSIVKQYLEYFDKVIKLETIEEYRNLTAPKIKILIDQWATEKGIVIQKQ